MDKGGLSSGLVPEKESVVVAAVGTELEVTPFLCYRRQTDGPQGRRILFIINKVVVVF